MSHNSTSKTTSLVRLIPVLIILLSLCPIFYTFHETSHTKDKLAAANTQAAETSAYYKACSTAEETLDLFSKDAITGMETFVSPKDFSFEIDDHRTLEITIEPLYEEWEKPYIITKWQVVSKKD